uniref:Immunoglobulin domain-containing protein n=1 Tax=Myripristis murdjan TaxID=586833 RepID=A0A667WGP9_9TELE
MLSCFCQTPLLQAWLYLCAIHNFFLSVIILIAMCDVTNTDVIYGGPPVSMGTEGEDVTVGCFYNLAKDKEKYFCKGTCTGEDILIETSQDRYQNVFYVTITQLTKSDSGTYYCGVNRTINDTYMNIQIDVQDGEFLLKMIFSNNNNNNNWYSCLNET